MRTDQIIIVVYRFVLLILLNLSLTGTALAQSLIEIQKTRDLIDNYRSKHEKTIIKDFVSLLSLPNVATNLSDMHRNADHIVALLKKRGFSMRLLESGGAPYIYGELAVPEATETIMIYAHFDGQPVLVENWAYPPFTPTLLDAPLQTGGKPIDLEKVRGKFNPEWRLYARSAGDDKMPVIALIHTLDALEANGIPLSVNLKVLLDGEEEQGSPGIARVLEEYGKLLDADLMLFCDGPMHQSRRAQLTFGVRGDTGVDITSYGATRPLHSGHYGNWAPNPIMELAYLLTSMRDEEGRITIQGYYDDVVPLSKLETTAIANMPDMTEALKDELAIHTPEGSGIRLEELITLPAVNVRGFVAGGVADKGRNIILSTATASLDLRLVPNQRPERVRELIESHVTKQGFYIVSDDPSAEILRQHKKVAKLEWHVGYPALRTAMDHPISLRLARIMRAIAPDLIMTPNMGGSLPLYEFGARLSAPIIILPLANHDNNQHAENENLRLQNLWDAIAAYGVILASYGLTEEN